MKDNDETTIGRDGVERWADGTPVSSNNAFRQAGTKPIDVRAMAISARSSANRSAHVAREAAKGNNLGKVYGLSRKSDERTLSRAAVTKTIALETKAKASSKRLANAKQMPSKCSSKEVATP
jgi:hypothetical protein